MYTCKALAHADALKTYYTYIPVKSYFKEVIYWNCMVVITQVITTIYCSISNLSIAFDKKRC